MEDIREDQYGTCNRAQITVPIRRACWNGMKLKKNERRRKSGYVGISASEQEQIVAHV